MPSPTYSEWRQVSSNVKGLIPSELKTRQLWCLACLVTQTNPDGSAKGS